MGMSTTHQTIDTETGCLRIVCGHCGHKQGAEPAVTDEGGWIYGSGADFCEECDRAFQEREEDRILVRTEHNNVIAISTGRLWEDEREFLVGLLTERDLAKYTAWLEEGER